MKTFDVKRETPILRCEICHQSDKFNSEVGLCERCSTIKLSKQSVNELVKKNANASPFDLEKYFINKYSYQWNKIGAISTIGMLFWLVTFLSVVYYLDYFDLLKWLGIFVCATPAICLIIFDRCPKCWINCPLSRPSNGKNCSNCNIKLK